MKEITYIHFSDLHIGDQLAVPLLSHVKDELLSDLEFIKKELGHVDIVFMTGDLVQTGAEKEFSEFEVFFDSLMQVLSDKGKVPVVFFVPGNHDLARTSDPANSTHQVIKNWISNSELQDGYFWNKDSEYIRYCEERFKYFNQFLREYNRKYDLSPRYGLLPGDTYHALDIKGIKVGVVGLNSSFLQIEGGDYQGKLGIYNQQITSLFDMRYVESLKSNDINFLLTHHNAEWFEPHSQSQYEGEIYKKSYVLEHFCGHNHIPKTSFHDDNFTGTSHVNVAPSLCGLEKFDDGSDKIDRIHGYHAGKYQIADDGSINKRFYPRIAFKRGGTFVFTSDQSYGLLKGTEYVDVRLRDSKVSNMDDEDSPANNIRDILSSPTKSGSDVKFHPVVLKDSAWYQGVRKQEQRQAISILNSKRCLWVTTSFGLGEEGFLHSIIRAMNVSINSIFMVDCDEVTSVDGLNRLIREHFSMPLNNLVDELQSAYPQPVLIFSNISTYFAQRALQELSEIARTVLHYNHKIRLVFVSSWVIPNDQFASVTLSPLGIQDVRHYLDVALPDEEFTAVEVEKIHGLTNGYPMCLDIVARNLAFASLDEMSDADFTFSNSALSIPQATKDYIRSLKDSSQQDENRCYRLLLLLSILPKGDVFTSIKRFSSTSPFRMSEVSTLIERELITIDHYYVIKNSVLISQNKVLRVPKIYRDYILSLEEPDSLRLHYQSICAMYLGDRWQSGEINLPKAHEDDYNPFFYYNLEAALSALLHHSIEQGDDAILSRYLKVAGNYVYKLSYQDMYYVALYVAKSFYQQVKDVSTIEGRSSLSFLKYQLAEAYRMNGQLNESISLFKEVIEEKILNKSDLQSSRVSLGLIYLNKRDYDNALYYADELLKGEKANKKTQNALTARYIKASFLRHKDRDLKELRSLYGALKNKGGQSIMLGNIAISIAEAAPTQASLKLLENESKNQKTIYTWMRVTLRRVSMYLLPQFSISLNEKDIEAVKKVYSFAFSQMLIPMVNTAHDILWNYYLGYADYLQLLTLLRHSIYAWELNGLKDKSSNYVQQILNDDGFKEWTKSYKGNNSETRALLENLTANPDFSLRES